MLELEVQQAGLQKETMRVERVRTRWKHEHEPEPRKDGVEPVPVLVASALGGVAQASVFGSLGLWVGGRTHTAGPGVTAAEGGSRGRRGRSGQVAPRTRK